MCDRQPRLAAKVTLLTLVHKWVSLIKVLLLKAFERCCRYREIFYLRIWKICGVCLIFLSKIRHLKYLCGN
jgi:hypothetical protein